MFDSALIMAGSDLHPDEDIQSHIGKNTLLIAADSGIRHFIASGVTPHYLVGDFDSVPPDVLASLRAENKIDIIHMPDQNSTDLQKAIDLALSRIPSEAPVTILACLSGRMDHTFGAIFMLSTFVNPSRFVLRDRKSEARILDRTYSFTGNAGDIIGVIPLNDVKGLKYKGLAYPAEGLAGPTGLGWTGICNPMTGDVATLEFDTGHVLFTKAASEAGKSYTLD